MVQHELGQSSANLSPDTVAEQAKGAVTTWRAKRGPPARHCARRRAGSAAPSSRA